MEKFELSLQSRAARGKGAAKRMRRQGMVPAVYYSHGAAGVALAVDGRELTQIMRGEGRSSLILLKGEESGLSGKHALIRDLVIDALTDRFVHLDLQGVELSEIIHVAVPIHLKGTPVGEKVGGGTTEVLMYELKIACRADSIPASIDLDISALDVGQVVHAGELALPEGVKLNVDPQAPVVHCEIRAELSVAAPKPAGAASAEGEAAAAPAAGEAKPAEKADKK